MAGYSSSYRRSIALVIGIDEYIDTSFSFIPGTVDDADSFAQLLRDLEIPFEVIILLGKEAIRSNILSELHKLREVDPEDRILFYFAGHGFTVTDQYGHDAGYIVAHETIYNKEYTAVPLHEILGLRYHSPAKHIGFIFDSCFSGQALGLSRGTSIAQDKYLSRRAYQVITAGAADQVVPDLTSMTQLLIAGVKEGNITDTDLITFSNTGLFLKETLASSVEKTHLPQFGHIEGSQGGEFILSASTAYWSLGPKSDEKVIVPIDLLQTNSLLDGIYSAEVDLSGRLDVLDSPTVMSISAGLSFSILFPAVEKGRALQMLIDLKPNLGETRRRIFLYSLLLFHLIKDHAHKLDHIQIDNEYIGHVPSIKNSLLSLLRSSGIVISSSQIEFANLSKKSQASIMASRIYQGEKDADWIITSEEVLSVLL